MGAGSSQQECDNLGSLVDLMDQSVLKEIRTTGQKLTNYPHEKFLLVILCSQAKGVAPLGYLNKRSLDRNKGKIKPSNGRITLP